MEPYIKHLLDSETDRQLKYRRYRDYYDGDQGVVLTPRQRAYLHVGADQEFSANYTHIVVDSLASRLRVLSFDAGGLTETLNKWLRGMRLDAIQFGVHASAIRDGDSYGFVEWDNKRQRPRLWPHLAYDGSSGVHAHYIPELPEPVVISKHWTVEAGPVGARRMNLYYADRVERYWTNAQTGTTDWLPGTGPASPFTPSLPAVDRYSHGLPIVHFTNRARGFRYGLSEIDPAIPMQDAINKAIVDLLAAADASGFRIMVMIGDDPTKLTLAPGSWVYVPDRTPSEASVFQIPGEPLRPHIEVVDSLVQRLAQVTDTPLSYFQQSGQMASEGTHRQHEARMLAKARAAGTEFGESWEEIMRAAIRQSNAIAGTSYNEDVEIQVRWDDYDIREREEKVLARAEAAAKLVEAGYSGRPAAEEAGFTEDAARKLADVGFIEMERAVRENAANPPMMGGNGANGNEPVGQKQG